MKLSVVVVVVVVVSAVLAALPVAGRTPVQSDEEKFADFMTRYNKFYETPKERAHRFEVFTRNLAIAAELDARSDESDFGITKFMDLSPEEFRANYLLHDGASTDIEAPSPVYDPSPLNDSYPSTYNWNTKGALTPVYNQGQCFSFYASATTENIESMWFLAGNNLTRLSMQQIVDCDPYDSGCGGGEPMTAYRYVIEAGGLDAYVDYPYVGVGGPCRFKKNDVAAKIKSWQWVTQDLNENVMQSFVYNTGPASICVDASTWQYYQGGVITKAFGCGTQIDHCVQLAGWETTNKGMVAWTVRNSWGLDWGEDGYLYVEKGGDVCGIAQECTSSII